jgi:hypothetical protein
MMRPHKSPEPPVVRFHIDHGESGALPPRRYDPQQAPGYIWHSTTQELLPIWPEDHPDHEKSMQAVIAAIRRWNGETSR